jgi:hypothetical protein
MALPKTFTGGERLFAADLNDNFEALDTAVAIAGSNATNASNLTSGTLASARLGDVPAANITGEVAEANFALKFARGTSNGSNTSAGATVTFPSGRFSTAPIVTTASASAENLRVNTIGGVSATGFTVYTYTANPVAYNNHIVHWIAAGV